MSELSPSSIKEITDVVNNMGFTNKLLTLLISLVGILGGYIIRQFKKDTEDRDAALAKRVDENCSAITKRIDEICVSCKDSQKDNRDEHRRIYERINELK